MGTVCYLNCAYRFRLTKNVEIFSQVNENSFRREFADAIKNMVQPIVVFVTSAARKDVKQIATFTAMLTPANLHACTERKPIMIAVSDLKIGALRRHSTPQEGNNVIMRRRARKEMVRKCSDTFAVSLSFSPPCLPFSYFSAIASWKLPCRVSMDFPRVLSQDNDCFPLDSHRLSTERTRGVQEIVRKGKERK